MIQNTKILYRNDLSLGARVTYYLIQDEDTMRYERAHNHGDGGNPLEPLILTNEELAKRVGKSLYSVRNYLDELKAAGLIKTSIRNAGTHFRFAQGFNPENDAYWNELWA
ncbi:winged helix-turn-helix transcriptional regulator [Streptomyces sp. P3]|uniref:winged helix-turn-helix transcriptional regulator n=1 Tax=Streptomyces sp. P3 TaxID=2135430 RepID=UPI000D1B4390|nr:winged helix-turn-helix transcriptional regulator [Streptomyces sp. P3]